MTQAPTPGPLSGDDVKLLVKGDLLRVIEAGSFLLGRGLVDGGVATVRSVDGPYVDVYGPAERSDNRASRFAFIGRPDADGWMPWSGGENPVPGQMVEVQTRGEADCGVFCRDVRLSGSFVWTRRSDGRVSSGDIIAFRLAPTAPVEASGSERDFETAEAMAEAWSDRVEIQRMVETTSAVFAKWASPELLSRFRQQTMAVIQQAYIEGVGARVEALRPQPSGETREAADAWRIRTKENLHGEGEPAGRWIVSNILSLSMDTAHWYEVQTLRVTAPSQADRDQMAAYGVSPGPAPVASGGQHSSGEMRVVPRRPTDRDVSEILYNINRKRNADAELSEADVREVMDNYFYNVGQPDPVPVAETAGEAEQPVTWLEEVQTADTTHSRRLFFGDPGSPQPSGETREALNIALAEHDHWIKEALKHKRPKGLRSDCENRDLERARIAKRIADKIATLIHPAPVASGGQHSSGKGEQ